MALEPRDSKHHRQIMAGAAARNKGHYFEKKLAYDLEQLVLDETAISHTPKGHIVIGHPAKELICYIVIREGFHCVKKIKSWWVGGLATTKEGDILLDQSNTPVKKCKSDVVIDIEHSKGTARLGISVKTCSKKKPTNDQLFFTTAKAFCNLLRRHSISVSENAETALRMFCGDQGYRPQDKVSNKNNGNSTLERWYWEELPKNGREDLEALFSHYQVQITEILLRKAYLDDPYPPDYLIHQTKEYSDLNKCNLAIFKISELVELSCKYSCFTKKKYKIKKGSHKNDNNLHEAPRFGFIQFQRGGQKQHPTQLQFNLQAGYHSKILQ